MVFLPHTHAPLLSRFLLSLFPPSLLASLDTKTVNYIISLGWFSFSLLFLLPQIYIFPLHCTPCLFSMNPNTSYNDIDRRMNYLIDRPASNHLLAHISHQASLVIPCHHLHENYKSPIPPLPTFVNLLAKRSCARTGTLLASLVLLDRLRQRLAQFARGMPCTCQRIFLATLIVTTKILHDTSPKNKHWTKYAMYFTLPEINLMEKQLLALMVRLSLMQYRTICMY